ncbi:MAG: Hpt domain-containing protein [Planctomycetota bacterium JB042]
MAPATDASVPSSEASCLDLQVVTALRELGGEDDPDLFDDLVETFAIDSPARLDSIEDAVRSSDPDALHRAAHGLKSSAANMGARDLAETCRRLENLGKDGTLDGAADLVPLARDRYRDALEALERLRGRA